MNTNKELYFNLMLFEGNAGAKLTEDKGSIFTILASYVCAKDEYNIDINKLIRNNRETSPNDVAVITKLITNSNIDYIINSDINRKDVDEFLKNNLDYDDPWEDAYEFMVAYKGTEDEITYKEVVNTILNDSLLKNYNPDTYADEISKNLRKYKSESNLEEMICRDLGDVLTTYDPISIATDRHDFKKICMFLTELYLKTLLTLNTCLVTIEDDTRESKAKNTSIVSVVVGYEDEEYDHELIERLFGGGLITNEYDKEVKMMGIFRAVEYFYTRVLDVLMNGGRIIHDVTYHANTVVLSKENQTAAVKLLDYMKETYPVTMMNNNLRDNKTKKKMERKKKPKTNHKKK